jgi:hypothetical protein
LSRSQVAKAAVRSAPVVWLASFLVGFGFHSIEGVSDPRTLWVGNLSWPYVLIPAVACVGQRSLATAVMRSVGCGVFMVLGFYNVLGLFSVSALEMGMEPGSPRQAVSAVAVRSYVEHLVLGRPGGIPWITVAILLGATLAASHHVAARADHAVLFWLTIGLIGLVEPILHFAPFLAWLPFGGYRFDSSAKAICVSECALGVLVLYQGLSAPARRTRAAAGHH